MRVGSEYAMQRGPTRKVRRVTLVDTVAPSGRSHWVLVRFESGISAGQVKQVSSQSLWPLSNSMPVKPPKARDSAPKRHTVPQDWMPVEGEAVAWKQTLGSRCTVLSVDPEKHVARIEALLMGVVKQFDAPIPELSPYVSPRPRIIDHEVEDQLAGRLPQPPSMPVPLKTKHTGVGSARLDEDVVERLIFSPGCIDFYRRRFCRRCKNAGQAEKRLRRELRGARPMRKNPQREYLRLRVPRRFDVVLRKRPEPGDFASCYVTGLELPARRRSAAAA